jgi:hypothetical protein
MSLPPNGSGSIENGTKIGYWLLHMHIAFGPTIRFITEAGEWNICRKQRAAEGTLASEGRVLFRDNESDITFLRSRRILRGGTDGWLGGCGCR